MAHGTPDSLDDMPEYLRLVRGGRLPTPELIAEMRRNYGAIGGKSPLTAMTLAQADALRARLGPGVPVAVGMRNWRPFIAAAIADLVSGGAERVIAIPLAPQFSSVSVQKYFDAASSSLADGVQLERIQSFAAHPRLLDAFAERVQQARPTADEHIVFTAHSVPERVVAAGDPYIDEVRTTARGIAERVARSDYSIAFQSAGRTPEPWVGPDVNEFIRSAAADGRTKLLIVPVGFVCDHTEILFDIDVQAAATARERGVTLRRTESLNSSPAFIDVLEDLVREKTDGH